MKKVVRSKEIKKTSSKPRYELLSSGKIKYYGRIFDGFNVPQKSDKAGKKMMVLAKVADKVKLIHFGAAGYGHNYSDAARASFRARHFCDSVTDKLTARYWACEYLWAGPQGNTAPSPQSRRGKY
ncbi:MAG: hypothetical protein K9M15_03115 [Candidatus Marinimicrobia bacterium]|nr:hypothetical protein [Candidatus Neomarinimicrobiota bacterium]